MSVTHCVQVQCVLYNISKVRSVMIINDAPAPRAADWQASAAGGTTPPIWVHSPCRYKCRGRKASFPPPWDYVLKQLEHRPPFTIMPLL